jgi:Ssp1 endopeptidase immunity protein Rap1a
MNKLKIAVAALAMMNTAANSQTAAHSQTGVDQWIAHCSKGASESERASCRSYVRGVADMIIFLQQSYPQVTTTCIPAGLTENDLVELALPYVRGQPPTSPPLSAANLLMNAFRAAFPCRTR